MKPGWFRWQGDIRGTAFLLEEASRGEAPRWLEESKEPWVSSAEVFKGDGVPFGREKAE